MAALVELGSTFAPLQPDLDVDVLHVVSDGLFRDAQSAPRRRAEARWTWSGAAPRARATARSVAA